jgi:hypothetical protein
MQTAIRRLFDICFKVNCALPSRIAQVFHIPYSIFHFRPSGDGGNPSRGTPQNPKILNIDGPWDDGTGPKGVEGGIDGRITKYHQISPNITKNLTLHPIIRSYPRLSRVIRGKIKNITPQNRPTPQLPQVFHFPFSIFHFFVFALLIPSAPAVQYFHYDKPDQTIATTNLENPLYYDSSIAVNDGKTYLTWLEFQPGKRDIVWFGERNGTNWLHKKQITTVSADCANPTLTIDKTGKIWLTYESAAEGNWHIYATSRNADGTFTKPVPVSEGHGANVSHHTAATKDGVWVVWQGDNKGQFDIFARHLGQSNSPTVQVSDSPLGDWHPTVAATESGDVFVAWDSYDGTAFNIRTRQLHNGQWGKVMSVTSSKNFNANPSIASASNTVWLAWEEDGPNWGKAYRVRTDAKKNSQKMSDDIGSVHRFRKLHLVELDKNNSSISFDGYHALSQPSFDLAAGRTNAPSGIKKLGVFYQSPQLTVDGSNRLWIVYRHFYMPLMGITGATHVQSDWGIYARCLQNGDWSELYSFDRGQGDALQNIYVTPTSNGISVAYTFGRTDRRNPQNFQEDELAPDKVVAHVSKKRSPGDMSDTDDEPTPNKKAARKPNRKPRNDDENAIPSNGRGVALATISANVEKQSLVFSASKSAQLKVEDSTAIKRKPLRPAIDFNNKHYELYYGDFHRHTDISLCFWPGDGTMDDAYRYGIDAAPLDFLGVTDHTHDIAMGDPLSLLWQRIRKEVNRHALEGKFIPFYSYERSRGDTDHNVISLRDDMLRPHTYPHSEFWRELDTNTFTIPHQPFNSVLWKTNDRMHRPIMEIYQGFRDHTCESDATNGLASGNEVGFIASSDHLSTGTSFACVWAEEPTRESLFRALQARRTFAAQDKTVLRVTCGEHWMGEKFETSEVQPLKIFARPANGPVTKLEAYIDGIAHELPLNRIAENEFEYKPDASLKGRHTIFIRVTESNGNFAWSSPMWINIVHQ